jgi:hypothetical protein
LGLFLCAGGPVFGISAAVEVVSPRDYFSTVQRELTKARSSISVCLYLYVLRPNASGSPVFQLTESLVRAHEAGVRVEVLLDRSFDFVGGHSTSLAGKNAAAYAFLRARNVPVFFESPSTLTHSKVVVIDEETVILGSSNWTEAALNDNQETNVLIRSKELARDVLTHLHAIPRADPARDETDPGVLLPVEFLQDEGFFGRMVSAGDDRALDTALFLLRERTLVSSSTFPLRTEALADTLGLSALGTQGARRQINKTLAKLQKRYGLIEAETSYGQEAKITTRFPESERWVRIPSGYWTLGWNRRLSFAGKSMFLVSLAESDSSPVPPRWARSRTSLSARYHLSPWFVTQGTMDLRRLNLLEVEYAPFRRDDPEPRHPSFYTPNALYDPAELERALNALRSTHGPDKVARAQKAAELVYEDSDLNGIATLIALENQFGRAHMEKALDRIGQKNPDNPRRTIAYLIAVIRTMEVPRN